MLWNKGGKLRKICKIILNIFFYIFLILLVIYIINLLICKVIYKDNIPRFFNYYIFNVTSGSMEESIHVGDYIIVKKADDFKVNDIVTYQKDNYFITHRIIEIDGDKVVTKGDANNVPDAEISKNDIIRKYYRKSKLLSFLIKNRFIIIGSILFLYMGVYILESNDKEDIDLKN